MTLLDVVLKNFRNDPGRYVSVASKSADLDMINQVHVNPDHLNTHVGFFKGFLLRGRKK